PARYHELKAVSHAPLALFALARTAAADGSLTEAQLADWQRFGERLKAASEDLGRRDFPKEMRERQEKILAASRQFVESALKNRCAPRADADRFARAAAPLVLASAADAAPAQIPRLHRHLTAPPPPHSPR